MQKYIKGNVKALVYLFNIWSRMANLYAYGYFFIYLVVTVHFSLK